ncbi:hypothetical protein J6590_009188 [Homalodisca vitripennis]|nr:hypothetical protein J6590_009188 [Homalodisca vitripennis]
MHVCFPDQYLQMVEAIQKWESPPGECSGRGCTDYIVKDTASMNDSTSKLYQWLVFVDSTVTIYCGVQVLHRKSRRDPHSYHTNVG